MRSILLAAALVSLAACGDSGGGFYARCTVSTDCADGFYCDDHLNGFCTTSCTSDDECESAFGVNAMCAGYDACIMNCDPDTECPADSFCYYDSSIDYGVCWNSLSP